MYLLVGWNGTTFTYRCHGFGLEFPNPGSPLRLSQSRRCSPAPFPRPPSPFLLWGWSWELEAQRLQITGWNKEQFTGNRNEIIKLTANETILITKDIRQRNYLRGKRRRILTPPCLYFSSQKGRSFFAHPSKDIKWYWAALWIWPCPIPLIWAETGTVGNII